MNSLLSFFACACIAFAFAASSASHHHKLSICVAVSEMLFSVATTAISVLYLKYLKIGCTLTGIQVFGKLSALMWNVSTSLSLFLVVVFPNRFIAWERHNKLFCSYFGVVSITALVLSVGPFIFDGYDETGMGSCSLTGAWGKTALFVGCISLFLPWLIGGFIVCKFNYSPAASHASSHKFRQAMRDMLFFLVMYSMTWFWFTFSQTAPFSAFASASPYLQLASSNSLTLLGLVVAFSWSRQLMKVTGACFRLVQRRVRSPPPLLETPLLDAATGIQVSEVGHGS
jgi:hypothetical protein